ncbi:MAG: alpha/beta hydrolase [Marinoscillum sp.]
MKAKRLKISLGVLILGLASCWLLYAACKSNQEQIPLTKDLRNEAPGDFVELSGGKTHYQLRGNESSELIIFIHGGGISGMEVWQKNIEYFAKKGYSTLSYDLFGRGYSDRPNARQTPELFHTQVTELIDTLNINREFSIVALSLGAITALDLYQSHPDLVKEIILIDPIASGSFKPKSILTFPVISDFILTTYWYPRAIKKQEREFVNKNLFKEYSERLSFFMNIKGYKETNISTWKYMLTQDKLDILETVNPNNVMILFGDKDPYFGYGQQYQYLSKFPSITMVEIDSAGHMPQYEQPENVNKIMLDFVRRDGLTYQL